MFYSMIRCYGTRIHLVGMGLVILLTKLADGMESPSASLAIVGGYGKGKVCILAQAELSSNFSFDLYSGKKKG